MDNVADRYELRQRLGGTADVYRAFDRELDRDVALRILAPDVDADYRARFLREAEAARDIGHPNVMAVLDSGLIGDRPFLARELVEGSTLEELLGRRGTLPEGEARILAEQIARGLAAAHARGVLHRDLNAGNVFVTAEGRPKVADFGMTTTPRNPAPEQLAGKRVDERTDVYGLGAILYQILTGHVPRGRPLRPAQLGGHSSKELAAIAMRALDPDPARRYPTAAAIADALGAPRPRVHAAKTTRTARRRASPLPLVVAALLIVLAVAALALVRPVPTRTAVLSATTTPQVTTTTQATSLPTLPPQPTSLPPIETTPEPPSPAPAPQAPVAEQAALSAPAATVRSFYDLVSQKRFDEAAVLWSARMQATYPPSTNIHGRFDRTRQIIVRGLGQTADTGDAATVTVDLLEVLDSGVTRHWVGQWQLVWDGARWLMDAPNLRSA